MHAFEAILVMLLGAVALLGVARRIGAPYPVLLAIAGAAVALLPVDIPFRLDPQLALALFVAPVLLDAAYDAPLRDLKRAWLALLGLVLVAVVLTTVGVAVLAHWLVPDLPWAAAIALGAIVAPPDASAATSILRQVPLPHRIRVLLEGESLLNDATALLIYRLAVSAAVAGGSIRAEVIAPAFLLSVVGSLVAGPAIAWAWMRVTRGVEDAPTSIILQFVSTFGIWIVAETLGLSAILTVVSYAFVVSRYAAATQPARLRVPSYAVWETSVVVLTALAFVLTGVQLGAIVRGLEAGTLAEWSGIAGAVLASVIAIRVAWALLCNAAFRLLPGSSGVDLPPDMDAPSMRGGFVIGWAGMRGIVTVAAALALPADFPQRGLLLFTAFVVVLGTLVIHGLTLKPLIRLLKLRDDAPVEREVREARIALAETGLAMIDGDDSEEAHHLRRELEIERATADEAEDGDGRPVLPAKQLRARVNERRRARLLALRRDGTIGDDAFHRLEEELDLADLGSPLEPARP
jgi:monovalent cation/hydrogen antiporter